MLQGIVLLPAYPCSTVCPTGEEQKLGFTLNTHVKRGKMQSSWTAMGEIMQS
jgi:hypothetical protein